MKANSTFSSIRQLSFKLASKEFESQISEPLAAISSITTTSVASLHTSTLATVALALGCSG